MKLKNNSLQTISVVINLLQKEKPLLLSIFMNWFNDHEDFNASNQLLATRLGVKRETINKAMKKLLELDILQITGKNPYRVNIYKVHPRIFVMMKNTKLSIAK